MDGLPLRRLALLAAVGLSSALGLVPAQPASGSGTPVVASYAGSGIDYLNNAPEWKAASRATFSYQLSGDGKQVRSFRATYTSSCGGGSGSIAGTNFPVNAAGVFSYRFSSMPRSQGAPQRIIYVTIVGRFANHRSSAAISYLVDAERAQKIVSRPYRTANPHQLGCASWVQGTAYPSAH